MHIIIIIAAYVVSLIGYCYYYVFMVLLLL